MPSYRDVASGTLESCQSTPERTCDSLASRGRLGVHSQTCRHVKLRRWYSTEANGAGCDGKLAAVPCMMLQLCCCLNKLGECHSWIWTSLSGRTACTWLGPRENEAAHAMHGVTSAFFSAPCILYERSRWKLGTPLEASAHSSSLGLVLFNASSQHEWHVCTDAQALPEQLAHDQAGGCTRTSSKSRSCIRRAPADRAVVKGAEALRELYLGSWASRGWPCFGACPATK